MEQTAKYKSFLLKFGYWAAIIGVALLFIRYLLGPLTPFLIAFAIAALLQPLARKLSAVLHVKRKPVAVILVILAYLLIAGGCVMAIIGIISALANWASGLPELFTKTISPWVTAKSAEMMELLSRFDPELNTSLSELLTDAVSALGKSVMDFSVNIVSWASSVGTRLPGIMLALVICVIATIFFASDFDTIKSSVSRMLPEKARSLIELVRLAFNTVIGNYARSYALILLMTFVEISVGLLLIGIEDAFLIGLVVAVFDILPVVGSGMVLLPWTIVRLIQGDIGVGIGLGILYLVVIVVRQIAEPKIVGKQVGLHPLLTLLCMWLGLQLFGGVGMFALPIMLLIGKDLKEDGIIFNNGDAAKQNPSGNPKPDAKVEEEENEVLL